MTRCRILDWSTVGTLTNKAGKQVICDHCSIPLHQSYWKDVKVFYNKTRAINSGYLCARCALIPTKKGNTKVTIQELDEYIQKKFSQLIKRQPI